MTGRISLHIHLFFLINELNFFLNMLFSYFEYTCEIIYSIYRIFIRCNFRLNNISNFQSYLTCYCSITGIEASQPHCCLIYVISLNMPHDNDAKCKILKGSSTEDANNQVHMNVMSRMLDHNTLPWIWSNCSRHYLTEYLQ